MNAINNANNAVNIEIVMLQQFAIEYFDDLYFHV